MKKLVILFSVTLVCFAAIAGNSGDSWIITKDGKMDCQKVNLGINKARIVLQDGQKEAVTFDEISALSLNGKIFTKLRIYADGKPTNQMAFMEFIKSWNDLSLYKLRYSDVSNPGEITNRYFLYKGNAFHLALDENTLRNTCEFFGLNYDTL